MLMLILILFYSCSVMSAQCTESFIKKARENLFEKNIHQIAKEALDTLQRPKIMHQDDTIRYISYDEAITTQQHSWSYIIPEKQTHKWSNRTYVFAFNKTDPEKNYAHIFNQEAAARNWVKEQLYPNDDCCCTTS